MQDYITIGETRISIGDKLRAKKEAEAHGICPWDTIVEVKQFLVREVVYVGLHSYQPHKNWGDLDGTVLSRHGLWRDSRNILDFFNLVRQEKIVAADFNYKKRNLKGMRCVVIHHDSKNKQNFVEFDDDVGGGSADGLGRMGHCVVLPSALLENVEKPTKDDPEAKKKVVEDSIEESNPSIDNHASYGKELWAIISDQQTRECIQFEQEPIAIYEQEPVAIKAKLKTRQLNAGKILWEKMKCGSSPSAERKEHENQWLSISDYGARGSIGTIGTTGTTVHDVSEDDSIF